MQGIRTARWRRIIFNYSLPIFVFLLLVFLDQASKKFFENMYTEQGTTVVIEGFFSFTYKFNTGAAWSFLADVSWGMTLFKVLTSIAIVILIVCYVYSIKKGSFWFTYSIVIMLGGTVGNFIDRILLGGVIDFLSFNFWGYNFPVFNLADSFLVVGVIMLIIYMLFLGEEALFKKKPTKDD